MRSVHCEKSCELKAQASYCTCHRLGSNKVPRDKVPHWYNVEFSGATVLMIECFIGQR